MSTTPFLDMRPESLPIDFGRLESQAAILWAQFYLATPWRHVVIDDFLEPSLAERAIGAFPEMGKAKLQLARTLGARAFRDPVGPSDAVMHAIFEALYDRRFVAFLEWMTGIAGLEPDRELAGAGFHQGAAGSYLRVHADHNAHPLDPSRFRRVNVMVYLNKGWKSEWNGDLELWDRHAIAPRKRIAPAFNRALIMEVDDTAYHGYGPLRTPRGRIRKALAAYYYSKLPAPGQSHEPHPTSFPDLGGENPAQAFAERIRRGALARVEKALRVP